MKNLITLNIRNWPWVEDFPPDPAWRLSTWLSTYHSELQRMSQRIFESSDKIAKAGGYGYGNRSKLSVIAWGQSGSTKYYSSRFALKQVPFLRGLRVDPYGHISVLAVQSKWQLIKYVEPDSDILNNGTYNELYDP